MGTTFNKAIAAGLTSAVSAFGALTTSCAGIFTIFGTSGGTAEVIAAGLIGVIAGGIVYWIPNKAAA